MSCRRLVTVGIQYVLDYVALTEIVGHRRPRLWVVTIRLSLMLNIFVSDFRYVGTFWNAGRLKGKWCQKLRQNFVILTQCKPYGSGGWDVWV